MSSTKEHHEHHQKSLPADSFPVKGHSASNTSSKDSSVKSHSHHSKGSKKEVELLQVDRLRSHHHQMLIR
jgi:hypothetical protein